MPRPILLDDPTTCPPEVRSVLDRHAGTLESYVRRERAIDAEREAANYSGDLVRIGRAGQASNEFRGKRDAVVGELRSVLADTDVVGFHCTRFTDDEVAAVRRGGVRVLTPSLVEERLAARVLAGDLPRALADEMRLRNCAQEQIRAGLAWFVLRQATLADEGAVERLLRSWGGEAVYWGREPHRGVLREPRRGGRRWDLLRRIGRPTIVRVRLRIGDLACGDVPEFLVAAYQSRIEPNFAPADCGYGAVRSDVGPDRVLDVLRLGDAEFEELTQSSTWREPLAS